MSIIRKIKKENATYYAEVENYRQDGKVKQRVKLYIGKEVDGKPVRKVNSEQIEVTAVKQFLDYHVLHEIIVKLGLPELLGTEAKYILLLVYTQIITRKPIYRLPEYADHTALKEILKLNKSVNKNLYNALDELEELNFSTIEDNFFKLFRLVEKKERL